MIDILKNLFRPDEAPSDGLNQKQREAIIDLLLLCMYADNHLALTEDHVLKAEVDAFDWKSEQSIEAYVDSITPKVRRIRSEGESRRDFISEIGNRLDSSSVKTKAFELSKRLFHSDGEVAETEAKFETEIKNGLGL